LNQLPSNNGRNFPGQVTPGQSNSSFGDNFTQGVNSNQPIEHVTASGQSAPDWPATVDYRWRMGGLGVEMNPVTSDSTTIIYNGSPVTFADAQPIMLNGQLMVPIRGFVEDIGGSAMWDTDNNEIFLDIPNHPALALSLSRTLGYEVDQGAVGRAERFSNQNPNDNGMGEVIAIGGHAYMAIADLATALNGTTDWQPGMTAATITSLDQYNDSMPSGDLGLRMDGYPNASMPDQVNPGFHMGE